MSGIAMMVPTKEMYRQAQKILAETENHVQILRYTTIETVIMETRKAIAEGVNIVIARGHQAREVEECTNVPVVEVSLTAQEVGVMVVKAKNLINKPRPRIGIFAWTGMICDISYFHMLYDVDIKMYALTENTDIPMLVDQALEEGMEIMIGGEKSVAYAQRLGVPALELETTGESLEVALKNAESMYYMSEVEQHNYAQLSTVLDSSFNGIIKISQAGVVLMTNRVMCQILGKDIEQITGRDIGEILTGLDMELVNKVLTGEMENYSTFLNTGVQSLVVVMEAIRVEGGIMGAIISCNRMKRLELSDEATLKEQFLHGYVAGGDLDTLAKSRPDLKAVTDEAKIFAQSGNPVLLLGRLGSDMEELAGGIHNYSLRKNGPYVVVDVGGMSEDDQMKNIFGNLNDGSAQAGKGAAFAANFGTLVIHGVDRLTRTCQYYLLRMIRQKQLKSYNMENENAARLNVRIICCSNANLYECMRQGTLRKDFYYAVQALTIRIPPLSERRNDLSALLDTCMDKYLNQYSRYHALSAGARQRILSYPWDCEDIQLEAFVDRMILTVGKRTISEDYVAALLQEMYGGIPMEYLSESADSGMEPAHSQGLDREKLLQTLEMYHGNRSLTARALGISTTTLWRKLKKYNID